ncbi:MAG: OmpA family protein [Bacteroidota bacterium]|nr:OmpA family protein [Bacteroidota bacterium]
MNNKLVLLIFAVFIASCVPISKFNEMKRKADDCDKFNQQNKTDIENLQVSNTELKSQLEVLTKERDKLLQDSLTRYQELKQMQLDYNKLEQQYHDFQLAQENTAKGNAKETTKLLSQLQEAQDNLQKREDELRKLEYTLEEKKRNLEALALQNEKTNKQMKEMAQSLSRKDSIVKALKNKLSAALMGLENNGLTIKIVNGKVYISLEEKLLFKSGSTAVDPGGVSALKKLARVLDQNPDINIMIEGHTDDVPYRADAAIKDNWDLSAKRATAIVRILLEGTNIDPKRFTAAGRSQYVPIDKAKSAEARQKNRRTEIILTPKLDELYKILESN